MLIASVVIYVSLQNLVIGHIPVPLEGEEQTPLTERPDYDYTLGSDKLKVCINIGKFLSIVMLLLAAVFHPSAINGIYFVIYLCAATWWACAKELDRGFGILLRCTIFIFIIHISSFMVYQTPWPQELLDKNTTVARVLGFTPLVYSHCGNFSNSSLDYTSLLLTTVESITENSTEVDINNSTMPSYDASFDDEDKQVEDDIRVIYFNKYNIDYYLNPIFLLLCYYTISITSVLLLGPKVTT